jgi:hypothetical protein
VSLTQTTRTPFTLRGSHLSPTDTKHMLTLDTAQPLFIGDTTDGNIEVELPPAGANQATGQSNQGQELIYRKVSADSNTLTVTGSPDGPQILTSNTGAASRVRFQSDGTDWWVVG